MKQFIQAFVVFIFLYISNIAVAQTLSQEVLNEAANSKSVYLDLKSQGANFYETQAAFNAYWENREVTKGQGYKPFKRWEAFMEERVFPSGEMFPAIATFTAGNQKTIQLLGSIEDPRRKWEMGMEGSARCVLTQATLQRIMLVLQEGEYGGL